MAIRFFFLLSLSLILSPTHAVFSEQSLTIKLPSDYHPSEKLTRLHFYYHDMRGEENPSMMQIVNAPKKVPYGFGSYFVMDDVMTEGPELSSKHVGRAQGFFGMASQQEFAEGMYLNFCFTEGMYVGSTITMLGRNLIAEQNREMSIVGGTGVFRLARGYAVANTVESISTLEHYVVEYNITVYHA